MKILAIGDLHGSLEKIKEMPIKQADLILLTGDLGSASLARKMAFENIERQKQGLPKKEYTSKEEKRAFMEAYTSSMRLVRYLARFAPVYIIFGNIEMSNAETRKFSKEIELDLPLLTNDLNAINGVKIINNKLIRFGNLRIGGLKYFIDTNWMRDFKPPEYQRRMRKAKKGTEKAKRVLGGFGSVDILLCHQPPYGYLDKVTAKFAPKDWQGKHAGSQTILRYIQSAQPRYVFCGHIHEGEGHKKIGKTDVYNLGVAGYKMIEI
jgi:Icc-related predicted phosphoesterase